MLNLQNNCFIASPVIDRGYPGGNKINYDKRYLDGMASIFHIGSPCAAITKGSAGTNIFYISYNRKVPSSDLFITRLQNTTNQAIIKLNEQPTSIDENHKSLLLEHLLLASTFCQDLKRLNKMTGHRLDIELLCKKIETIGFDFEKLLLINAKVSLSGKILTEVLGMYYALISNQGPIHPELYSFLLKPLQDVTKVLSLLKNVASTEILVHEVHNIENKDLNGVKELHAEVNLGFYAQKLGLRSYIGISKLSCPPCHETLKVLGYENRGTHGLSFNGWNKQLELSEYSDDAKTETRLSPSQKEQLNKIIAGFKTLAEVSKGENKAYDEQGQFTLETKLRQHRKLSFDDEYEQVPLLQKGKAKLVEFQRQASVPSASAEDIQKELSTTVMSETKSASDLLSSNESEEEGGGASAASCQLYAALLIKDEDVQQEDDSSSEESIEHINMYSHLDPDRKSLGDSDTSTNTE